LSAVSHEASGVVWEGHFHGGKAMALVLSRKSGEAITIDSITITVERIGKGRVRLSIQAPKEVSVRRSELKPKAA